ncbi:hypothetical protein BDR22DRAFT_717696 [Usnea florida]
MQYSTILAAAAAIFMAGHTSAQEPAPQVNFYYDDSCQDYAGSEYPSNGVVTGGPYGSEAIIWVHGGAPDNPCCGSTLYACKNSQCSASDQVSVGQCKSFRNGIWAKYVCFGGCE